MIHSIRQRLFRWVLPLSLLLSIGCVAAWFLGWNPEEYAVYEASIREAFGDEADSYYVILETTETLERFGIRSFHSDRLGLPLSARLSYTSKNLFRFHIPPRFHLPHEFRMISRKELVAAYSPDQLASANASELNKLLRKSWGVITLSRVGFDVKGTHAVVYAQLTYCGLCGQGVYLYLSKESGVWHIVGRASTWIS
jgi:hypothetical protein